MGHSRFEPDNLIAESAHAATVQTVTVKSGEGVLARGTVLARDEDNKFAAACNELTGKAEVILAEDIDATDADAIAEVYNSGDFLENALHTKVQTTGEGSETTTTVYTLTAEDRLNLKKAGIYLIAGIEQ